MAALAPTQPIFNFSGYSRNKLENQIEQIEEEWQDERIQRIELQKLLKIEQNSNNTLHWELRETKIQLEKELKSHHELKRNWETAKTTYEKTLENEKTLKREKKELKTRLGTLQEDITKLEQQLKKSKDIEKNLNSQIDLLRQENLTEEGHDISYKQREIDRASEKIKDFEKKLEETKRGFEIERNRYQNRQGEVGNDMKRIQLEREKALSDLENSQKRIEEKNKQLAKSFEEMEKLEQEVKQADEELETLHGRVLELEQDKRQLKREIEETKKETSERLTKETSDYVNRLNQMRLKNQKLTSKVEEMTLEREEWVMKLKEEMRLKVEEIKMDGEVLRDENRKLAATLKDLRREDLKTNPHADETYQLRQELDMVRTLLEKQKSQREEEQKQFLKDLEEEEKKNSKLHREIDQLHKDSNQVKFDTKEIHNELDRKVTKFQEKNKRLVVELAQYKKENERLIGDQQQFKNLAESDTRRKIETIAKLEAEVLELEKKNERFEDKLKSVNYDLKEAKSEIDRLNLLLEGLKKEKIKLAEIEKQESLALSDAKRKETELNNKISVLSTSIDSWKEKSRHAELRVQEISSELERTRENLRTTEISVERLSLELSNVLKKGRELEAKVVEKEKAKVECQDKALLDVKKLNQLITDLQNQITRLKSGKERQHKEEIENIKNEEDARRRELEVENNRALNSLNVQIGDLQAVVIQLRRQIQENDVLIRRREEEIDFLRNQISSSYLENSGEIQNQSDEVNAKFRAFKEQITTLEKQRDNLLIETSRLEKQIQFLENSRTEPLNQIEQLQKEQRQFKENERHLRGEIAARDAKINSLTGQQETLKSEVNRLNAENLSLESEKARLVRKGDETSAVATLEVTVSRLREDISEKESFIDHLLAENKTKKKELEKELDDIMEVLNAKIKETEILKKSKENLEKDYNEISSILEEKISVGTSAESLYFQKQIHHLNEQLTQVSVEHIALKDQLAKVSAEKSELKTELARLKTVESGDTKKKNEWDRVINQKEALILSKLLKEIQPSDKSDIKSNPEQYAVILVQSRLRGKRDRALFHQHNQRHKIVQEIFTSEKSYVVFLKTIVDSYISPLQKLNLLPPEKLKSIFGNSEEIYKTNQNLLAELEERVEGWNVSKTVGDIFLKFGDSLGVYVKYKQFLSAKGILGQNIEEKSVENFIMIVETMPQMAGLSLQDLLNLPIQRLSHYVLLLQKLYAHTPKHHPDHTLLSKVLPHFQQFSN